MSGVQEVVKNDPQFIAHKVNEHVCISPCAAASDGASSHFHDSHYQLSRNGYGKYVFIESNAVFYFGDSTSLYNEGHSATGNGHFASREEEKDVCVLPQTVPESSYIWPDVRTNSAVETVNSAGDCVRPGSKKSSFHNDDVNDHICHGNEDSDSDNSLAGDFSNDDQKEVKPKATLTELHNSNIGYHHQFVKTSQQVYSPDSNASPQMAYGKVTDLSQSEERSEPFSTPYDDNKYDNFRNDNSAYLCDSSTVLTQVNSDAINCSESPHQTYNQSIGDFPHSPILTQIIPSSQSSGKYKKYSKNQRIFECGEVGSPSYYDDPGCFALYHQHTLEYHKNYPSSEESHHMADTMKNLSVFLPTASSNQCFNDSHGLSTFNVSQQSSSSVSHVYHPESAIRLIQDQGYCRSFVDGKGNARIGIVDTDPDLREYTCDAHQSLCANERPLIYPWMKKSQSGKGEWSVLIPV